MKTATVSLPFRVGAGAGGEADSRVASRARVGPAGGRDPLGIALRARRPGGLDPAAVGLLPGDQERPAAEQMRTGSVRIRRWPARSRPAPCRRPRGRDLTNGPQPPSSDWAFRRRSRLRAAQRGGPGETVGGRGHEHHRGVDDGARPRGRAASCRLSSIGSRNRPGRRTRRALAGQVGRQEPSVGRRRARFVLALERPGSVGRLIAGEPVAGRRAGPAESLTWPARCAVGQGRRELHAGQPLVAEGTVAAVVVPAVGVGQPAGRVGQSIGLGDGDSRAQTARRGRGRHRRCCGRRSNGSRATSAGPRGRGRRSPGPRGLARAGSPAAAARPCESSGDATSTGRCASRSAPVPVSERGLTATGRSSVIASWTCFSLIGLERTISRSSAGSFSLRRGLAGAEQDQGDQGMPVLVGLLVHVGQRVDRLGAQAVDVEDDGVGRGLAVPLRRALGVAHEEDAVAHASRFFRRASWISAWASTQRTFLLAERLDSRCWPGVEGLGRAPRWSSSLGAQDDELVLLLRLLAGVRSVLPGVVRWPRPRPDRR